MIRLLTIAGAFALATGTQACPVAGTSIVTSSGAIITSFGQLEPTEAGKMPICRWSATGPAGGIGVPSSSPEGLLGLDPTLAAVANGPVGTTATLPPTLPNFEGSLGSVTTARYDRDERMAVANDMGTATERTARVIVVDKLPVGHVTGTRTIYWICATSGMPLRMDVQAIAGGTPYAGTSGPVWTAGYLLGPNPMVAAR